MIRRMKKFFCVFCVSVLVSVVNVGASAAGSSIMSLSSSNINVGESVTVSINIKTDGAKNIYAVVGTVEYNEDIFDYVSSNVVANGGGGTVKFAPTATGVQSIIVEFTFKAKAKGLGQFSLTDCQYSNGNDIDVIGSSEYIIVSKAKKGDINCDGEIDVLDLIVLKKCIAKNSDDFVSSADINSDGAVNGTDLVMLKKMLIGINS